MIDFYHSLKKYNYWNQPLQKTGLRRSLYLNNISQYIGNTLIKVLVGQRRSGKSYVLRQIIAQLLQDGTPANSIFYFNKELIAFEDIKTHKELHALIEYYKEKQKPNGKIYIFLDEIQEIENWEKLVNSYAGDPIGSYELFITGSNSTILSSELSTYLSGRYVEFEIHPFSYKEFLTNYSKKQGKESYIDYLKEGGLPEFINLNGKEVQQNYIQSLYNTIILKDVINHYKIRDGHLLRQLFKYLCNHTGKLFSTSKIVNTLKSNGVSCNNETISNYIQYLCDVFLIYPVERYDIKGKQILTTPRKYYLNDLSFASYFGTSQELGIEKHLENAVYMHYRRLGYKISVGEINGKEIDFIIEKNKIKEYIQVSYLLHDEKTIKREFGNLDLISDSHKKTVISMDDIEIEYGNGIQHIQAWKL